MRKQKSPSSFLLIIVCSLLISLFLSHLEARTTPQPICSSSCGEITNITYPFRLSSDPPGCGDPYYELSCDGSNRTLLHYLSGSYYVKQISYQNSTIRLVDVNLATGSCSLPSTSLSLADVNTADARFQQIYVNSFATFVNCSTHVSETTYIKVPCLSTNTSSVYVTVDGITFSDLEPSCSFTSMVPTLQEEPKNRSYEDMVQLLESGFELGWSVFCWDCHQSGGSCYISSFEEPQTDYCSTDVVTLVIYYVSSLLGSLLLVVILVVRFGIVPLVLVVFLIHKYVETSKKVDNVEQFLKNQQSTLPRRYSYTDLMAITNHFRDKLGQGGFGSVYKGQLPGGCFIAVKMLNSSSKFSGEEFINEVSTIGRIHHRNVVQLLGFCSEGSHRALVYEYMPNGSLDKHIFLKKGEAKSFTWEKLHEIALGAALGIKYLHEGCDVCILHFDIKPHNVLLDHDCVPKIADFGLAKFYPKERDIVSISTTRGTIGYIAPELISKNFGVVSCKTDVYSFGMVLLEMVGGRKNVDGKAANTSKVYFPLWAYDHLSGGEDLQLENVTENESKIAQKLCTIGLWCIQMKANDRPSMSRVIEMLQGKIEDLEMPPKPVFSSPKHMSFKDSQLYSDSSTELLISECVTVEDSLYTNDSNV